MTIFSMVSEKSMLGNPLLSDSDRSGFQAYFFQDHAKSPKRLASSAAAAMGTSARPSKRDCGAALPVKF